MRRCFSPSTPRLRLTDPDWQPPLLPIVIAALDERGQRVPIGVLPVIPRVAGYALVLEGEGRVEANAVNQWLARRVIAAEPRGSGDRR